MRKNTRLYFSRCSNVGVLSACDDIIDIDVFIDNFHSNNSIDPCSSSYLKIVSLCFWERLFSYFSVFPNLYLFRHILVQFTFPARLSRFSIYLKFRSLLLYFLRLFSISHFLLLPSVLIYFPLSTGFESCSTLHIRYICI